MTTKSALQFFDNAPLQAGSLLYQNYVQQTPAIQAFYDHPYTRHLNWPDITPAREITQSQRHRVAEILLKANRAIGNSNAKVLANLEALAEPGTMCIVTGQQAGIFCGPLYTIHKILTAVALSRSLTRRYPGRRFVPVFWGSTDDHDFREMAGAAFVSPLNEIIHQQYETGDSHLRPAHSMPVPGNLPILLDSFFTTLGEKPFMGDVKAILNESLTAATSLGDWFCRSIARMVGHEGVICLDSHLPAIRYMMRPIFIKEIEHAGETSRLVSLAGERLVQIGYHAQIERRANALNIFYHRDGRRYRLLCSNGNFEADQLGLRWTSAELCALVENEPESFSPGVTLRPIVQDAILPTAAYVAGPGEIAYFAQLKEIYRLFNLTMPVIYPRASLTIIDPKIQRLLEKFGLNFASIYREGPDLIHRRLNDSFPEPLDQQFETARQNIKSQLDALISPIRAIEDGAGQSAQKMFGQIDVTLKQVKEKTLQAHRRNNQAARQQLTTILTHLLPEGHLQERFFHAFGYLAYYGPDMLIDLADFIAGIIEGRHE